MPSANRSMARENPLSERGRLGAWWRGESRRTTENNGPRDPFSEPLLLTRLAPDQPLRETIEDRGKAWSKWRVEAAEMIWGRDFLMPGGLELTLDLAKPLALNPAVTLLDMNANLGGGTRAIAERFGTWVTGLEANSDLAAEGNLRSKQRDLDKKAQISVYNPEQFELKPRSFDCVFARELLFQIENKEQLFANVSEGLKDKGQFLFTDLVTPDAASANTLSDWLQNEKLAFPPRSFAQTIEAANAAGLDCRIKEDISGIYCTHILRAFAKVVEKLEANAMPEHLKKPVLREIESWAMRFQLIHSGALRLYRFHCFAT